MTVFFLFFCSFIDSRFQRQRMDFAAFCPAQTGPNGLKLGNPADYECAIYVCRGRCRDTGRRLRIYNNQCRWTMYTLRRHIEWHRIGCGSVFMVCAIFFFFFLHLTSIVILFYPIRVRVNVWTIFHKIKPHSATRKLYSFTFRGCRWSDHRTLSDLFYLSHQSTISINMQLQPKRSNVI